MLLRHFNFLPPSLRWRRNNIYAKRRFAKDAANGNAKARRQFFLRHGFALNLAHPETHNERVYLRKLRDHNPRYSQLCDKVAVRSYVDEVLGANASETLFVPLLAQVSSFDALPDHVWDQDVILKCTHGSGMNIVVRAGDFKAQRIARKRIHRWLGTVHGAGRFEWAYFDLKPSVIAEPLLDGGQLSDLKLYYYDGALRFVMHEDNSSKPPKLGFYSHQWDRLDVKFRKFLAGDQVPKPAHFEKIVETATPLAQGFDAIRVDFLVTDNRFYLGEITVYDGSGLGVFATYEGDKDFAQYWRQPHLNVDLN